MNDVRFMKGLFVLLFFMPAARGWSDELPQALQRVSEDIRVAQEDLTKQRDTDAAARLALNGKMVQLEQRVSALNEEVKALRLTESHDRDQLNQMTERARRSRDEISALFSLVREYRKASETRLSAAELEYYDGRYLALDALLKKTDDPSGLYDTVSQTLRLAEAISRNKQAGLRFKGQCVNSDGAVEEGEIATIADVSFFAGEQDAGLCINRKEHLLPGLFSAGLTRADREVVRALMAGRPASVPVDVTAGRAMVWSEQNRTLWQHIQAGGVVMIPIVITGLLALYLSVMKGLQLLQIGRDTAVFHMPDALAALRSGDVGVQRRYFESIPDRMSYLITPLIEYRRESHEKIEEIMHDRILATMPALEKYLGTLAVLGGVAPLLGLLGTVTGIIHVFKMVTVFGSGDASILSGGISEALITTEFGLIIAIPVLLIHAWLSRRVRLILGEWERVAVGLIQGMEHE